ncbi:MAG: hypothetical protein QNL91_02705 [Candidatus Krumholzibacteria bacterium]|nr:hypothetical protein [Candidatus Krumholzibacteria bacterium]
MRHFLCAALFVSIFSFALPVLVQAQTSIGYGNPTDIANLLEYRLPDWSYRVWDAEFSFGGRGNDRRAGGDVNFGNSTSLLLGSDYFQAWESEKRHLSLRGDVGGKYRRNHDGTPTREQQSRELSGQYGLDGRLQRYLAEGPFSVSVRAESRRGYTERLRSQRIVDDWEDDDSYYRSNRHTAHAGLGWGRVRNVEPVLRAQRLSERLVALGRAPLLAAQVQEIAAVWAQQSGYFSVYDRYERHFWDEVLTPMLDPANPLTAYEILYLMEVMREDLTGRRQGMELLAEVGYSESHSDGSLQEQNLRARTPRLAFSASRNLSLTQQIELLAAYVYSWSNSNDNSRDYGYATLEVAHLWNLTDRYRLDTSARYRGGSEIQREYREQQGALSSSFSIYLEDQLSLNVNAMASFQWTDLDDRVAQTWNWTYGVGLVYHLDRAIF